MKRILLCALVLLLPVALATGEPSEEAGEASKDVPPIHEKGVTGLAVQIRTMYLREDHETLRPTLYKLQESCRELNTEDKLVYGDQVVSFDRGMHRALDRTRELAADGLWEESEKQFEWVLRTCTRCHQTAREEGFGPPVPLP